MSISSLTQQHFMLRGSDFILRQNGLWVVLFYHPQCPQSRSFLNTYKQVASNSQNIKFAVIDVSKFRDVVKMSHSSKTKITKTPTVFFFSNGGARGLYNIEPNHINNPQKFMGSVMHFYQSCSNNSSGGAPQNQQH